MYITNEFLISEEKKMNIMELKLQDAGPDLSKGELVSEYWATEEDGTPYVERTYISNDDAARAKTDYKKYYKDRSYGATGWVEVRAEFAWDTAAQKAYVKNVTGDYHNGGGVSQTRNESKTSSGNGTAKASAKYSIEVDKNLGGWTTYSVTMTCDYKGNCNGDLV